MENVVMTKVIRVGTSLGIIIPKTLLQQLDIQRGDTVVYGCYGPGQCLVRRLSEAELKHLRPREINI